MKRILIRSLLAIGVVLVTAMVLLVALGARYAPNTAIPGGFQGAHTIVKGVPLRVVQRGSGRDVLLIHGSPGSVEDWTPVVDALSESFRVTAFDRPGHGFSGDTGVYSFEHNAEMALALVDALKLTRVIVVGHSYGGTTALAMALRDSPAVSAYVIVDSATYLPSRQPTPMLRALHLPLLGLGLATVLGPSAAPAKIREGILDQFAGRSPPEGFVALRTRIWSTPKVTHAIAEETLGSAKNLASLSPGYRSIHRPVHIMAEADNAFRRTTAERLHAEVAGSKLELLAGTGHYLQVEKVAEVVATIRRVADAN